MSDFSAAVHRVRNNTVDTILVPIILFRVYLMAGLGTRQPSAGRLVIFAPRPHRLRDAKRAMGTRMWRVISNV